MFNLTFQQYKKLLNNSRLKVHELVIPIYKEIVVDTETPVSLFLKIAKKEKYAYLLESAETNLQWGRFSFISIYPYLIFRSKRKDIELEKESKKYNLRQQDPFEEIRKILNKFKLYNDVKDLPRFFGGLVGYISYDNVDLIEPKIKLPSKDEFKDIPDIYLTFNKVVLIFDHYLNKLKIVYLLTLDVLSDIKQKYFEAVSTIEEIHKTITTTISLPKELSYKNLKFSLDNYNTNISRKDFTRIVNKTKNYIYAGDIIQAVLSRRVSKQTDADPFDIYRALRLINPSPYMFYLKFDNLALIGSSPEILVRKDGEFVETRPIAGTRPRGETEEKENLLEKELLSSEKENAEHVMLVDLARNDIGRISEYSTIALPQFRIIEKFSHVMHIVSSVKGKVKNGIDCVDILKATFPAGTVSGAPKVRAMEIIYELEKETRGPYGGAVGYFSLTGNMDMAITIRTILYKDKKIYIQTGAGIVADSVADKEFEETVNKAKALLTAVEMAETIKK